MNPNSTVPVSGSAPPSRRLLPWLALTLLALFTFFFHLGSAPLFDLDEALYVTCARQMTLTGDYVTPRLNSRSNLNPQQTATAFFEKPILIYWAAAGSMKVFGVSEGAARLPSALAALIVTLLVAMIGSRWFGPRAGLLAGMVYATAPMTFADARQMTTDGLLVLWFTLTLMGAYRAITRRETPHETWGGALLFWGSAALAVLTKGVIGLLLPGLVLTVTLLLREFRFRAPRAETGRWQLAWVVRLHSLRRLFPALRALHPLTGVVLFLALILPWHLTIARSTEQDAQGRTFVQEYLIRQHVGRFRGGDKVHNAPLPSYFVFFLIGFFPWACFAPAAFRDPNTRQTDGEDASPSDTPIAPHTFLLIWFWTVLVFFTLSAAKLPTYIVPAYPAAAMLVGRWLDSILAGITQSPAKRSLQRGTFAAMLTAAILTAATLLAPRFTPAKSPVPPDVAQLALHLTLLLLLGCGAAWGCFLVANHQEKEASDKRPSLLRTGGLAALALMMLGLVGVAATEGYTVVEREVMGPYQRAARAASPEEKGGSRVVFYGIVPRRPSMLFYANYAPLERKETPLLPWARGLFRAEETMNVVTSKAVYDTELRAELEAAPDVQARILHTEAAAGGGWIVVQLRFSTKK